MAMPIAFAFKNAARAAQLDNSRIDAAIDLEIAHFTGGPFCHVETWYDGTLTQAVCFSSRQPGGTGSVVLDLSDESLWTLVRVETTPLQDAMVKGYVIGCSPRRYDTFGILGIGAVETFHDPYDRICSETGYEIWSRVLGNIYAPKVDAGAAWNVQPWQVAPSGVTIPGKRYGFYEILKGVA